MSDPGRGYITDIPYTRGFYRELAPAWLDFTATVSGTSPPVADDRFTCCELGCGQGVTTVMLAATHPHGDFFGIDLMPEHIDHAHRFADQAGVANATFFAADFAAENLNLPQFDYMAAHGVYAWIDPVSQAALRRLIDRHLKPGGLLYLSYNAMPGLAADLPFQRLLVTLAGDLPGDSAARFKACVPLLRRLAAAGAPSLAASPIVAELDDLLARYPIAYVAHEYMGKHWRPLFVTEVRQAMASIGLFPAGAAVLAENFDAYVLRRAERDSLAGIDDPDIREQARDYLLNQRFRRDVYSRAGADLDDHERRRLLLAMRYSLTRPPEKIAYEGDVGAGRLAFDNDTAHAIVGKLAAGPCTGSDMVSPATGAQDVVANLMALCAAGMARPVSPHDALVNALNRAVYARLDGPEAIENIALSCGTALRMDQAILRALRDGSGGEDAADWARFLAIHAPA
ncbi:MAG TPA: class I SAM-dependent methyltransferase [Stellaceae bacterium]|nr:class I SAM-dependent methyltransferase [Stellaceae bacterium]